MRLRWRVCALLGVAGAFAIGAFVGTGFGSGDSGYSAPATALPSHASPAGKLVSASGGGGGGEPAIKHFTAESRSVNTGIADLVRAKCPKDFPNPITGGAFTSGPGLSIVNLSLKNPGGQTKARSMYIAVLNVSSGTLQWKPEVVCGKNIKD